MMNEETIEKFAIQCAKGNNGGEWSSHYTDEQKEFWRNFVRQMANEFYEQGHNDSRSGTAAALFASLFEVRQ